MNFPPLARCFGDPNMVEGSGFAGRREERLRAERLRKFIEGKNKIIVFPDISEVEKVKKPNGKRSKRARSTATQ
jgi:hypothetical protein